jgi:hypothetical protein
VRFCPRVAANPRTVDRAAVESLQAILDHQRRLEDAIGAAALTGPALAQLEVIDGLVDDARGALRPAVVDTAAQWAQFAGWLHATTGMPDRARDRYARALEWATEVGNPDMVATMLNLRGHIAWRAGQAGPVIGLVLDYGLHVEPPLRLRRGATKRWRSESQSRDSDARPNR